MDGQTIGTIIASVAGIAIAYNRGRYAKLRKVNRSIRKNHIYERALENSPDAVVVVDSRGRIVIFNQQAEYMFGYSFKEITSAQVERLIPEISRQQHVQNRGKFMEHPRRREMGEGMDLLAMHRDGTEFPVQIMLSPMVVPKFGVHVMAVIRKQQSKRE